MKLVPVVVMLFGALAVLSGTAYAQRMRLAEVLVVNVPDLKPDADMKAFERYVLTQVAPAWKKSAPGMELHLVRADRGSRKGQYMLLRTKVGDFRPELQPFVSGGGQYHEYHLVSPEKAGQLPEVEILGIHYTKVRPERRAAFEAFVADKLHPAVANLRPDIRVLYYKSVRGPDEGNYLAVFALTVASRDKYWPRGADSDELRAAFSPAIRELAKELRTYLVEGSYADDPKLAAAVYESREWTDFVVIPPVR